MQRALQAATDRLWVEDRGLPKGDRATDVPSASQRRADALAWEVLDIGRKTRTVPASMRRALHARDAHCHFPGCTASICDAHHVEHWVDGGVTSLENLVLLCRRHHRAVHEGGYTLMRAGDGVTTVLRPDGELMGPAPELAPPLTWTWNTDRIPVWDGAPFELGYAVEVLYRPPACDTTTATPPS